MSGLSRFILFALCAYALAGCASTRQITLVADQSNAVAYWHDVGAKTVIADMPSPRTDEEKYAAFSFDMAAMHLAMYDAVSLINQRYEPVYAAQRGDLTGASADAAAGAAAYGVLSGLFPGRAVHYQQAYETFMASIPAGDAKKRGIALGSDVAATILARRALDGRAAALPDYPLGTVAGAYRGRNPIVRYFPLIRPFTLTSMAQFRPAPPPALESAQYAADFNEVKEYGGKVSQRRTAEQLELARFHTEGPQTYITRNFGRFARSTSDVGDAARLMAILYTGYTDAIGACFEAKYYYNAWRPLSAIPLADTDGNPATTADPAWAPVLPTPPHPEYPAAHSCTAGALGELLQRYYGSDNVSYTMDSMVTRTTRTYANVNVLEEESIRARIHGGMHFRYATRAGEKLGKEVADWTMDHAFLKRSK